MWDLDCRTCRLRGPKRFWQSARLRQVQGALGWSGMIRPVGVRFPKQRHVLAAGLEWTAGICSRGRAVGGGRRFESLIPLLHLLDRLAEVRRRFGDLGLASSASEYPCVPEELPRCHAEVWVLLETLHEEVSCGLEEPR